MKQIGLVLTVLALLCGCTSRHEPSQVILVMDPLARDLACACVGEYAQRDYSALAAYLSRATGSRFETVFADELGKGIRLAGHRPVTLVVGKDALVRSDAAELNVTLAPLCRLTDREGLTTLTGLFVVKSNDLARSLADLKERTVFFGKEESVEKHRAAMEALRAAGVRVPDKPETRAGCTETALCVEESAAASPSAGVISSYAWPLLEGCGSIPPGSLRVLGRTAPVPFITVFTTPAMPPSKAARLLEALLRMREQPALLRQMESRQGFVPHESVTTALGATDWPEWRGRLRDGHIARLPSRLPDKSRIAWRTPLSGPGLAGLAATTNLVLVADRDPLDVSDSFLAFRAADGELAWQLSYPARGDLDYGQAPRATPLMHDGRAFLLGACGLLHCVQADTGKILWKRDLQRDFGAKLPKWGYCSPPLLFEHTLIVNPGAPNASLAALDVRSGRTLWTSPGEPPAYGALILADLGGRRQVVGHDEHALCGWDPRTGRRLWRLAPPVSGDFNVPTPVAHEGRLLVTTENNGARLYEFRNDGTIIPEPVIANAKLACETSSPVIAGGCVYGWDSTLRCLDLANGLKELWNLDSSVSGSHASLIADDSRLLLFTDSGDLLLLGLGRQPSIISRLRVTSSDTAGYAHPALAGNRLFLRDATHLLCLAIDGSGEIARREAPEMDLDKKSGPH